MANIKELKSRIKTTKNTHKITGAMKLVSAAKLNRAQQAILGARPYANELDGTIKTIAALTQNYSHQFLEENEENKQALLLVISSDKGLCGGYNSQLNKTVRKFVTENSDLDFKLVYVGKKVRDLVKKEFNSGKTFTFEKNEPSFEEIKKLAEELALYFADGEIGKVFIAYNSFKSALEFIPTCKQVLPMTMSTEEKEELKKDFPFDFKYDETPKDILDALIPEAYISNVYISVLDAIAAEHGARMTAMDNATSNCSDMIKKLTLKMNKLRQAAITTELIEVVSGAESLNG